jgi:uncharacterized membrane protein
MVPTTIAALGGTAIAMTILDAIWLGLIAFPFYRAYIGHLLAPAPHWPPAILFYLMYIVGIVIFAVLPSLTGPWYKALALGAVLGIFAYGTYDLTNHATMKDWPLIVTVVDMAWGAFITGTAATAGYFAVKFFGY